MKDPKRFYTYAYLREDRTPYYIGKGNGKRIYQKRKGAGIYYPKDKSRIIFLKQNLTEEEAFKHEIYMIAVLGRKDLGTGILRNKTNGGEGNSGKIVSDATKRKLSESHKGKTPSDETRRKQSEVKMGHKHSDETKRKIKEGNTGKKHSEETKRKLCDIRRDKFIPIKTKEKLSKAGKKGSAKNKENKVGIFSLNKEQLSENAKKANSQKWMCLETGYITNAGALSTYQKKRGIDTSKRKRIS